MTPTTEKSELYKLIDRLKIHSEWKFPNRLWSEETYQNIAFAWLHKQDELLRQVEKLEAEMKTNICANCKHCSLSDGWHYCSKYNQAVSENETCLSFTKKSD